VPFWKSKASVSPPHAQATIYEKETGAERHTKGAGITWIQKCSENEVEKKIAEQGR
jgi:hypothetical protein